GEVKKFAERMVTDHEKAYEEVKKLAAGKGVILPTNVGAKTKEYDRIAKLSGAEFDREYMKLMVKDHNKDVKAFQHEAKSAKDADVKGWAAQTLPTLQDQQKMAKDVAAQVQASKSGSRDGSASADMKKL